MLKIDINRIVKKKTENIPIKWKITNPSQCGANKKSNKNREAASRRIWWQKNNRGPVR
ncbi:hypothetical protein [Paraburkholderia sacchari]|uniref:hypothetical protein n=1 Tax=Paraburkholderia sacchari TaxID=159450 RepID=UPI003D999EC3